MYNLEEYSRSRKLCRFGFPMTGNRLLVRIQADLSVGSIKAEFLDGLTTDSRIQFK